VNAARKPAQPTVPSLSVIADGRSIPIVHLSKSVLVVLGLEPTDGGARPRHQAHAI
jgi:hypothetical protein